MRRHSRFPYFAVFATLFFLSNADFSVAQDPEQYLRDHYVGKILVLRGFYSANHLSYDSSGMPKQSDAGDWTVSGFVRVEEIHDSNDVAVLRARRFAAEFRAGRFELRALAGTQPHRRRASPVVVTIEANFPQHNPSPEQVDALMSRIFLTSGDYLADSVPDYWKSCVNGGIAEGAKECLFSPEMLAVAGLASAGSAAPAKIQYGRDANASNDPVFRVGRDVTPPRVTYQVDPEFTESARLEKFHGTVTLGLVVNRNGLPTYVHILNPLGSGLDAKAVEAVQAWKFEPARRDGRPVAVQIAVEVDFRLY